MGTILQLILNGIALGSIYSLLAVGLTLIYGILEIVNFSHGALVMLSLYLTYVLFNSFGIDPYVAIIIITPIFFLFGVLLQSTIISRLIEAPRFSQIFATYGLGLVFVGFIYMSFGADFYNVMPKYVFKNIMFFGVVITLPNLIAVLVNIVTMSLLFLFLYRTYTGKAIRALAQQRRGSKIVGINVPFIYAISFGIGIALSSIAASTLSTLLSINPNIGDYIIVVVFVTVILGGYNSLVGSLLGGILIGLIEVFTGYYLSSHLKEVMYLFLFVSILVFKPTGLLGTEEIR